MKNNIKYLYEEFEQSMGNPDSELLNLLLKFCSKEFEETPIIFDLIADKKINILLELHKRDKPFTYHDSSGANALHVACGHSGSLDATRFLIENNIITNINASTDSGETPFLLAVQYNHEDIIKYLFRCCNPDLNIKTLYGDTVFTLAIKNKNKKLLKILNENLEIH